MLGRLLLQTIGFVAALGVLLFLAAGQWRWPAAWLFLGEIAVASLGVGLWLNHHDPALLESRLALTHRDQSRWDRVFIAAAFLLMAAWIVLIGLDVRRFGQNRIPLALEVVGALAIAGGMVIAWRTFAANTFAAPQIRIQTGRGHHVVDHGPYAIVRHPMYAGAIVYLFGMPLLLGSIWGLWTAPLFVIVFGWRILEEERALRAALPAYAGYAERVRFRLVPGVW